jgi:hypothetical protein
MSRQARDRYDNSCSKRTVLLSADIVGNHMGPPSSGADFHEFTPFNSTEHYHGTLSTHCGDINTNQHQREVCWLANLGAQRFVLFLLAERFALSTFKLLGMFRSSVSMSMSMSIGDLKQEDPWVAQQLIDWMAGLQKTYAFEGVRIDTVPYVNQSFWHQFQE